MKADAKLKFVMGLISVGRRSSAGWVKTSNLKREEGRLIIPAGWALGARKLQVPPVGEKQPIWVVVYHDGTKVLSHVFWPDDGDYAEVESWYTEAKRTLRGRK